MPTLSFVEHQFRPYRALPALSPAALDALERLNSAAGAAILTPERKGLRAGGQVGVARAGALQVEILPRLGGAGKDSPAQVAEQLFALLSLAFDLPLRIEPRGELASGAGTWVEALARLFAAGLLRELQDGLPRGYVHEAQTQPVLHGRWDVQRQITRGGGLRSEFAVRYAEFTSDLPLNRLFRFVIEQLARQPFQRQTRALLAELRGRFAGVTLLPEFPPMLAHSIRLNRMQQRFAQSLALARLFLNGRPLRLRAGSVPVASFTFSMAALFERAVAGLFSSYPAITLPPERRDSAIIRQGQGLRLYLARAGRQPVHPLRPDLLLRRPGEPAPWLVIDTKYKALPPDPSDLYQALAYASRLHCATALLLYPQSGAPVRQPLRVEGAPVTIWLATLDLRSPGEPLAQELAGILRVLLE